MNWRDFFYFSKGERRALTLLLCLITISWLLLLSKEENLVPVPSETVADRTEILSAANSKRISTEKDSSKQESKTIRKESSSPIVTRRKTFIPTKKKAFPIYPRIEKYPEGTIIELNTADTTSLKKIPGIGTTFARRIVKYRELLGGFYTVEQLAEVYGIDAERYEALAPWFTVDTGQIRPLDIQTLPAADLLRHPYLNYSQVKVILQLRKQKSRLSGWENLLLLEEFTDTDRERLTPYLLFAPPS